MCRKPLNEGKSQMVGIYFSGTGNSRYAAEFFCNEYNEAVKAFSIEDDNVIEAVRNEEMLVFAYPVQYSTVPKILREFIIENKGLWKNKKVFVIATMGCLVVMEQEFLGGFYSNTEQK